MKTIATLFLMFISFGFLFSQEIECFVLVPPEKIFENVKKVSVLDFNGEKGKILSEYIVSELLNDKRGITAIGGGFFSSAKAGQTFQKGTRTNVYAIVERGQLEKVLSEQNLSNTGLINDSQAAQIGAIMGIDAIITGNVSYSSKDEEKKNEYKDTKTGAIRYSYCTKRTVTSEVSMKIINVTTGEVIGNKISKMTASDNKCDEKRSGLASPSELANSCLKGSAAELVNYFNPYFKHTKYRFDKIRVKEFKDRAKEAEDYIKNYDFNNAYAIHKAIFDIDPYNASSALNLGSLYHIVGDFDKAREYWSMAAEIAPKDYQPLVQRADKDIEMSKFLEKFNVIIEKTSFETKADALAAKATTRGRKTDRYDVKTEPNLSSETIAKVPGDTEFTIIENKGEWVLIKLLGGKQGYINSKDVKL